MLKDPKKTKDEIVQWIRNYFRDNGPGRSAVIGISGGKDSTIAATLCVEALGKESVVGVLMPNGIQSDIQDSYKVVESLGINYHVVNIGDSVSGHCLSFCVRSSRTGAVHETAGKNTSAGRYSKNGQQSNPRFGS